MDPDLEVKDAMNEINKQKRERLATEERAEAEKMLTVTRAAAFRALPGRFSSAEGVFRESADSPSAL